MLLRSLVQHADSHRGNVPDYYQRRPVMWQIDLPTAAGAEPLVIDLRTARGVEPRRITVPYTGRSGTVPQPFLLADYALYVLAHPGLVKQPDGEKTPSTVPKDVAKAEQRHAAYRAMLTSWCDRHPELPQTRAVATWLTGTHMPDLWQDGMDHGDLVALSVDGFWLHELPEAQQWWAEQVRNTKGDNRNGSGQGLCLVCGHTEPLLSTLPVPVKGLPNPGMNTQLICLNQPAHYRAGTKQLGATPVCVGCGTKAVTALNALLADREHRTFAGESAIVWWTRDPATETSMWTLDNPEPAEVAQLVDGLRHPRTGLAALATLDEDAFYAVTLRVNTNRVVIADWITIPVPELKRRLGAWFADQETWDGWDGTRRHWSVWRLALAAARWDRRKNTYVEATVPHHLQADLTAAALHGTPPPAHLLPVLLQRIRADHHIDLPRIALLRLALTRTTTRHKELCMPRLNTTSTEPGYVCGRLMAMLESIQRKAMPNVNTSITDKYLTTAVASPRIILTRLSIGAHPHLRTIARTSQPAARAMEHRLQEAFELLDALPAHLDTEQQSLFILGYAHQRAHSHRAAIEAKKARDAGKELAADQAADALPETTDDTDTPE